CIGATFPLAVRVLARDESEATAAGASVYAWNTIGAVIGAIAAGFFLLPAVQHANPPPPAAAVNPGPGPGAPRRCSCRGRPRGAPVRGWPLLAALLALALIRPAEPWNLLRSSPLGPASGQGATAYYAVGRAATVLALDQHGAWELSTNGLPEAVIQPRG